MSYYGTDPQQKPQRYRPVQPMTGVEPSRVQNMPAVGGPMQPQTGGPQMRSATGAYTPPVPTAKGDDMVAHKLPGAGGMPPGQSNRAMNYGRANDRILNRVQRMKPPGTVPPVRPPIAPPPPRAPMPESGPDGSLSGQAFLPGDDARLQGAQGATDAAMKRIMDGGDFSTRAGAGAERFRALLGSGQVDPSAMIDGPNRTELAKQALADFDLAGERSLAQRFRKVGQSAAKFGRMGSGMVTTELGDLQSDFERDRMLRENELARGVAEGDISDRFRRVDYETGLAERNQDRAFDRGRTAIDYGGRDADRDIAGEYDALGAAGSLEDRVFGQGQSNRNEYRTERGFQEGRRQQTLEEAIRRRELENAEQEASFRRSYLQSQAGR